VRLIAAPLATQEIRTDANGHFDFGEQPPREYALGASMVKKLAAIQHVDLRDPAFSTVELVLGECAAGLYGKVTDASGTPIPGAQLLREGVVGAETDVGGNYELCTLPTAALFAEVRLVVRAHGFGTIILPLAPNGQMHRDFVLAPEASITGRLLDVDGAPMLGARVTVDLAAPEGSASRERGVSISALTGDDGTFRLAGLSAGEYLVAASSASAVANAVTVDLEAAETRDIELRASPTGVLRGRVVARGLPVGGVSVAAGDETAVSQNDGAFVLARVPVGDVELKTAPYRRTSGVVRIVAGDRNTAEVTVEPLGVIRGTVRRHGRAVPFARVDVVGPSSAGVTADASGRYEADGLEAGTYGFYSDDRRRGAMTVEDRAIELGPGETREHDIELAWGGAISGRVVDKDGVPVVGATVGFRGGMSTSCLSDASGVFACGNLRGGKYSASVHPASGASYPFRFVEPPTEIELRDGDARVDGVRLVVAPAVFAIEGKVVDGAGAPVTDVAVNAFGLDRGSRGKFQIPPNTITNGDGQFRIIGLSPGEYLVEVQRRGLAARERVAAGATNISLLLDRPPCDGAGGHAVPTSLVKPPSPVVWDQKIELVGWSLPTTIKRGESVEVVVVYRTLKSLERDWTIFAHFDSPEIRVNGDHDPGIGWCPTKDWKAGEAVVDRTTVRFDKPDRYALTIGFFTGWAPSWDNLPISVAPAEMNDAKQQGVHLTDVLVTE
jgi:protocatechuate 3,4-dioxygenase beta subunit